MSYNLLVGMPTEDLWKVYYPSGMRIAQAVVSLIHQNTPNVDLANSVVANVPEGIREGVVEATCWFSLTWNPELQQYELGEKFGPRSVTLVLE